MPRFRKIRRLSRPIWGPRVPSSRAPADGPRGVENCQPRGVVRRITYPARCGVPRTGSRSRHDSAAPSGGEQQMLAVARMLRTGARLLLLDEISEGLAPVIVQKLGEVIRTLRAKGFTVVLVEQNFRFAAPLADRFYVMESGRIVKQFDQSELGSQMGLLHEYLGV